MFMMSTGVGNISRRCNNLPGSTAWCRMWESGTMPARIMHIKPALSSPAEWITLYCRAFPSTGGRHVLEVLFPVSFLQKQDVNRVSCRGLGV